MPVTTRPVRGLPDAIPSDDPSRSETEEEHVEVSKKEWAVRFINEVRSMQPSLLGEMILREAGEELAQFFMTYSSSLITQDAGKASENISSLMLMGYLIRAHEERMKAGRATQVSANA